MRFCLTFGLSSHPRLLGRSPVLCGAKNGHNRFQLSLAFKSANCSRPGRYCPLFFCNLGDQVILHVSD